MATDYEKFYQENKQGLGKPTKEFVSFFDGYTKAPARVLDVGCGQGRDALFIARKGHQVVAIDHSPTGIADLVADAEKENLSIIASVADIRTCPFEGLYDVVVVDRTLHMLEKEARLHVLGALLKHIRPRGHLLIADEKSNMHGFKSLLLGHKGNWRFFLERGGYLFAQQGVF